MNDALQLKYGGKGQTLAVNVNRIGEIVDAAAKDMELATTGEKVPLRDLARVKQIASNYLRECADSGMLPTVRGVAARLGLSRNALYDHKKKHPDDDVTRWLEDFSDLCGELTMQAALDGAVAAVPALFTAKARYGWRETITIETPNTTPLGQTVDVEQLEHYLDVLDTTED